MKKKGAEGIISLGADYRSAPRSMWGSKDWERYEASQPKHSSSSDPVIFATNPVGSVGGLYASAYSDELHRGRQSRKVDALIEELGLRPMRRKRTVRALGRVIR